MKQLLAVIIAILALTVRLHAQEISPYLFGQNHWIAKGDEGGRVGYLHLLWPKVQESGVKSVRIGGNGYEHNFPSRERLIAMVDSIQDIGAEPILQVPRKFTAAQARELVEYFTEPGKRKVQYWSIGNEPLLRRKITVDEVHTYIMRIAPAMKMVDPTIKIFVFDECELRQSAYRNLCGGRLDLTGLKQSGSWLIDGFSFHKYPNGRDFNRDNVVFSGPETIRRQAKILLGMIGEANRKHARTSDSALMWAFTEFNVTYANPNREISGYGNPSFLGGQFIAEIFGICMEYGAFSANPWCINETDAVNTDFGYIGMPREFYPRSSYYHIQTMAQNMHGQFMFTANNQRYVKTIASKSNDDFCVMIMNQSQNNDFDFDLVLNKDGKSRKLLSVYVDAGLDKKISGRISNQTTMLFVFSKTGHVKKQYTYGLTHNLKHLPPDLN